MFTSTENSHEKIAPLFRRLKYIKRIVLFVKKKVRHPLILLRQSRGGVAGTQSLVTCGTPVGCDESPAHLRLEVTWIAKPVPRVIVQKERVDIEAFV